MTKEYLKVSYSSLNLLDNCMRKFEFNKLYPRRPRDPDQFAADVGTCLHHGYQDFLIHQNMDSAIWKMMQSYPYLDEFGQRNDDRSLEACFSTLEEMCLDTQMNEWELMTIVNPQGEVVPAIEVPYEIRLMGIELPDGRGIAHTGFMDAAMRHVGTGLVRTMDIKTHRRTREDATPKYKYDGQQIPYGIVLEHVQGNPITEFEVLYLDTFVDLVTPRVQPYTFQKDSTDIQEWLLNTVLRAQRIQRAMEMDYFPRTDGGCLSWNRPCYFLDICALRDRDAITDWLLMGDEPEARRDETPWIVCEIDVFGDAH